MWYLCILYVRTFGHRSVPVFMLATPPRSQSKVTLNTELK